MTPDPAKSHVSHPFRRAVLRGVGVVLPPLLTVVILLWIANSVQKFILSPVETMSRHAIVWYMNETVTSEPDPNTPDDPFRKFVALRVDQWVPKYIRDTVDNDVARNGDEVPPNGRAYYHRYVKSHILKRSFVIPVFSAGFIMAMYLLGKFLAAGVGRFLWGAMEKVITQLPIIRVVYSSVKQVTDFFFGENSIEFSRVVAVEYPRKGIWSLGFVTGESMQSLQAVAEEPVISVLMPTSPVPGTGFTITVRKSETIDLDIPIDQALQFVVSCGVVVPDLEMAREVNAKIATAVSRASHGHSETALTRLHSESP